MITISLDNLTVFLHRRPGQPLEQRVRTGENERPAGDGWTFVQEELDTRGAVRWVWKREVRPA